MRMPLHGRKQFAGKGEAGDKVGGLFGFFGVDDFKQSLWDEG